MPSKVQRESWVPMLEQIQSHSPLSRELIVLVGKIAFIIFAVEVVIMMFLSGWDLNSAVVREGLVDASCLTLFASPLIYSWVVHPFAESERQILPAFL